MEIFGFNVIKIEGVIVMVKFLVLVCNGYFGNLCKDVVVRVMLINNFIVVIEFFGLEC